MESTLTVGWIVQGGNDPPDEVRSGNDDGHEEHDGPRGFVLLYVRFGEKSGSAQDLGTGHGRIPGHVVGVFSSQTFFV